LCGPSHILIMDDQPSGANTPAENLEVCGGAKGGK
jgi:hypothetical protein